MPQEGALQAGVAHQPLDPLAPHLHTATAQRGVHPRRAVRAAGAGVDLGDVRGDLGVGSLPWRRIRRPGDPVVVGRRRHADRAQDRVDPETLLQLLDQGYDRLLVGSISWAKKRSPPSGSRWPGGVRRSPCAAAAAPRPRPWWGGRCTCRGWPHPGGSSCARPRDVRPAARPADGSLAAGRCHARAAPHGRAARRGTSSVLPQRLPSDPQGHDRRSPGYRGNLKAAVAR